MPFRSFCLLILICFIWSLNVVVSKLVIGDMGIPPLFYAALRSLLVLAVLIRFVLPLPEDWMRVALVTLSVSGGSFALLFLGLREASPSSAAVVTLSSAPLTVMFAILILHEHIGWRRGVGIALTFVGVGVAVASPTGLESGWGLLLVFLSAALGALGTVFMKRIALDALRLQSWAGLSSAVVLFPASFAAESGQFSAVLAAGWPFAAALLFSALIVSVAAHTAYFRLLQTHDANLIAPLTLMTPIFTMGLGIWLTGDDVGPWLIAGALISATGVLVILVRPRFAGLKPLMVRGRI